MSGATASHPRADTRGDGPTNDAMPASRKAWAWRNSDVLFPSRVHRSKQLFHWNVDARPLPPLPTQSHAALFMFGEPPGLPRLPPVPPR